MLVILSFALFWYTVVPIAGAFAVRRSWRLFRSRFNDLRDAPLLDYAAYRDGGDKDRDFRFLGGFESVNDDRILWVRNENLTVPVRLEGARIYLLPSAEEGEEFNFESEGEAPEHIRWNRLDALSDGVRVYIGGRLRTAGGRRIFSSCREGPLLIILYDGADRTLMLRTVKAGRQKNEYWNPATPLSLAVGICSQLVIAVGYLPRPAFRLAALTAFAAMFGPLFPLAPPGVLFTALYRRLWRRARIFRVYRDLVRLPLVHIAADCGLGRLPDGSAYGYREYEEIPIVEDPPQAIPPGERLSGGGGWRVYGSLEGSAADAGPGHPGRPKDPMGAYVLIPGDPIRLARTYVRKAYAYEAAAMATLLAGLLANASFVGFILFLLR